MTKKINIKGKCGVGKYALVDDKDFELVNQYRWRLLRQGDRECAISKSKINKTKNVFMHRIILGVSDSRKLVDHINHKCLDNRRSNIRICNKSQNGMNRGSQKGSFSKYKGVSWDNDREKWKARIVANKKTKFLGRFYNEKEAANAYDIAAIKLHKEFIYNRRLLCV